MRSSLSSKRATAGNEAPDTAGGAADLSDIGDYIAQDDRQAARRFVRSLRERCAFLAENPRVGRERPDLGEGLRSFPVGNYVIVYRLLDGVVEIVNVIHGSRDIESPVREA